MTDVAATAMLRIPERTIPVPASVSPAAQAALSVPALGNVPYPALDDAEGWRNRVTMMDAGLLSRFEAMGARVRAEVVEREIDGVAIFDITPEGIAPGHERAVYLDIHGGALIMGGGAVCRAMGLRAARRAGLRTWSVDYRMPPDHPYPAPLDDCVTAYRALLRECRPEEIVVGGGSAGGNLVAAMVLRARDEGLPLPRAAVLLTPEVDLTESGDTFETNRGVDTVLVGSLMPANELYAAGHDLRHPYLSPLFGDFSKGFPPTLLQAGTRDLFLSNTVRMHRALLAAGVPAELHVFEAMPHGGFFGAPEDAELDAQVRTFIHAQLA